MYTSNSNETYTIEYNTVSGETYTDPIKTYTRDFARQVVRDIRTRNIYRMFELGRRAALKDVKVIKA